MKTAIVWFKKDLRATDHRPLFEATQKYDRVIGLYIYEPEWLASFESDASHLEFINESLKELSAQLALKNIALITRYGKAVDIFQKIKGDYSYVAVYAHQETGVSWTFKRDVEVASYLKSQSVLFKEYYQFAVVRRLQDRDSWNELRHKIIGRQLIPELRSLPNKINEELSIRSARDFNLKPHTKEIQKGGRESALKTLKTFLEYRSDNYLKNISSPETSQESGSRLSPYLTYGLLSLTEVHHALRGVEKFKSPAQRKNLWAFESRLWWHCHFIQKLESEYEIEFANVNRGFDGLRESEFNTSHFSAWCKGETGFPMIDATMRCLQKTGWINFRMRAMLVSFASYQLWLHWKPTADFLAPHFLDFEAGIHFSQFQMQSGVTGINAIRIYNPVKQAKEQMHAARFIKRYCPELAAVPDEYVHLPSEMPPLLRLEIGFKLGETYPEPIVDPQGSYNLAKSRIFDFRQRPEVQDCRGEVIRKHASRQNSRHFPTQDRQSVFGRAKKE